MEKLKHQLFRPMTEIDQVETDSNLLRPELK